MDFEAKYQCINDDCLSEYPLNEVIYTCRKCGSLLQVIHNKAKLRKRSAAGWVKTFEERYKTSRWPFGSGVWGKKEWVLPNIDDENIVSMYEGATNLFWAERLGRQLGLPDLWVKLCGNSHTGSFKDLGMTVLVSQVKQMMSEGVPLRAVACASTGDTSAALAGYGAYAGIPTIIFLPKNKVSTAQLIQPVANGALVLSLDTDFDGCMNIVKEVCEDQGIYLANSMNSLRIEGQKTISVELVQQFDWVVPDWVVIPGGNLGNVSALGKGFLLMRDLGLIDRLPRICLAQSERANPLYLSYQKGFESFEPVTAQKTLASAIQIGNPVSVQKAIRVLKQFNGIVEQATEGELANAAAEADRTGLFTDPHTGVALAAMKKLLKRGDIKKSDKVAVISTAHGLKFTGFKTDYHQQKLADVESRHINQPIECAADIDTVKKIINKELKGLTP